MNTATIEPQSLQQGYGGLGAAGTASKSEVRNGPPEMSAVSSLSGGKRTWREQFNSVATDPQATFERLPPSTDKIARIITS